MSSYEDLSFIHNAPHQLADFLEKGSYSDILYYEFHQIMPENDEWASNRRDGLSNFIESTRKVNTIFLSHGIIDEEPATIHIALKIANEWFISREAGSNFYLGFGPRGIKELRAACYKKKIISFLRRDNFEEWINETFGPPEDSKNNTPKNKELQQFESLMKQIRLFVIDMQRRPSQFKDLQEEDIRDRLLMTLNPIFQNRGNAEAKNNKGKTDILLRTENALNDHIFELKIWKGLQSLLKTIDQLKSYLSSHNNHCGILMFCKVKNFTQVLEKIKTEFKANTAYFFKQGAIENEFILKTQHPVDAGKDIDLRLFLIHLYE